MQGLLAEQALPLRRTDREPEIFRSVVAALEHPGLPVRVRNVPDVPPPLFRASAAVLAILLGRDSPLWIDLDWSSSAAVWLQSCSALTLVTEPSMARAALITRPACMPPLDQFRMGDAESPAPPATVIVQVDEITADPRSFSCATHRPRSVQRPLPGGLSPNFWNSWSHLRRAYPPGLNVLFTWQDLLSAISSPPVKK